MLFAKVAFPGLRPPYDVIVADPPWLFASNSDARPGKNARSAYPCLTIRELEQLPVGEIAAKDALLYMWITAPMAELAFNVMRAWGFSYKSQLVWVKSRIATGYWARNRHEPVLICTRGNFPCPRPAPHKDSVIVAPQREHSRKPEALQDQIDAAFGGLRRVELFARRARPGWDAWGNETGKFEYDDITADSEICSA